ncbi:MAG: hypothetical protein ACXACX_22850 [Candidatus Hodarchaeales archaeon]|jgi:hypothetical protein
MKKLKTFENVIKMEGETKKKKLIRYLKFFLLPFYRAHEINKVEYEIGKIKSKRTFFRRFLSPLTIIGMACILFIFWCAIFPDWASTPSRNWRIRMGYPC